MKLLTPVASCAVLLLAATTGQLANAQSPDQTLRAPATPLIVHDPYFSIWSMSDRLTDSTTRHWTGTRQPLNGLVRVDAKTYRYLGDANGEIPAMEETHREITPTRTIVNLAVAGDRVEVNVSHAGLSRRSCGNGAAGHVPYLGCEVARWSDA